MTNEEVLVALAPLVGCPFTDETGARITSLTGRPRVVAPNGITTKEFDQSRIHVIAGGNGVITGFRFG